MTESWSSAATALYGACVYVKEKLSLVEVMGYTGHAFRINIHADTVDVAGPTAYDWEKFFTKGLMNLGFTCKAIRTKDFIPPTPEELTKAISLVQDSIDKGIPAVAWDMFIPEFGNIYGYDDDNKVFMAKDPKADGHLQYEKLGRGEIHELFVLTIDKQLEVTETEMLKGALELAVDHAYNREHEFPNPPFENGIKGCEAWIHAFQKQKVSDFGNAYNAAVVHDARKFAALFFEDISHKESINDDVRHLAKQTSQKYGEIAEHLNQLVRMFPFPQGGNPNDPLEAKRAIEILYDAKGKEEQVIKILEEMLTKLD